MDAIPAEIAPRHWKVPRVGTLAVVAVVLILVGAGLTVGVPHWQKLQLIGHVEAFSGRVLTEYHGPEWLQETVGSEDRDLFNHVIVVEADDVNDGLLASVSAQPELRELHVSGRNVTPTGLAYLSRAHQLRYVSLVDCRMTDDDLPVLKGLPELELLRLAHNDVKGPGLIHLDRLKNLKHLDLTYCPISDEGLWYIARLEHLESLDLSGSAITNEGIERLEQLENLTELDLFSTAVGDDAVEALSRIPKLKTVNVVDTRMTRRGAELLRKLRPDVAVEFNWEPDDHR